MRPRSPRGSLRGSLRGQAPAEFFQGPGIRLNALQIRRSHSGHDFGQFGGNPLVLFGGHFLVGLEDEANPVGIFEKIVADLIFQKAAFGQCLPQSVEVCVQLENALRITAVQPTGCHADQQFDAIERFRCLFDICFKSKIGEQPAGD